MILSFDSCIVIDTVRGRREDFRDRILDLVTAGEPLHLSVIVHYELMYGVYHSASPARQLAKLNGILGFFQIDDWTREDAEATARLRAELRSRGRTPPAADALIAGQAQARGWSLVTTNARDFSWVPGLSVIDWTAPLA